MSMPQVPLLIDKLYFVSWSNTRGRADIGLELAWAQGVALGFQLIMVSAAKPSDHNGRLWETACLRGQLRGSRLFRCQSKVSVAWKDWLC